MTGQDNRDLEEDGKEESGRKTERAGKREGKCSRLLVSSSLSDKDKCKEGRRGKNRERQTDRV